MRDHSRLLLMILGIMSLVLVLLGSFVRSSGAGLSCPDWPLCFGEMVPPMEPGVFQEYTHRVLAACVTVLTFSYAFYRGFRRRENPFLWHISLVLAALVIIQAVFGGLTVLLDLSPLVVTTHLALGTIFLQIIAQVAMPPLPGSPRKSNGVNVTLASLAGLTFLQILLGAFTASSGASLSCPRFPYCPEIFEGGALFSRRLTIAIHGTLGTLILLKALYLFAVSRRSELNYAPAVVLGLLLAQAMIGIGVVHMGLPLPMVLFHAVTAQLILFILLRHALRATLSSRVPISHRGA